MRVSTTQILGFADAFVIVPPTELDTLLKIIDWNALRKIMHLVKGDYKVLYDKGVTSDNNNRDVLKRHGLQDGIMRKKPKGKAIGRWQKLRNILISKRRFVVERTFGTMKRLHGLHRARYIGIEKVGFELILKSIAYNIKRANNQ